jgi:hypothetical protein
MCKTLALEHTACSMEKTQDKCPSVCVRAAPFLYTLPFCCQTPPPARSLGLFQHVPPGLCWGLASLRALPPTPMWDRERETHSSLCHFPSWAAKGLRPQPPTPSLSTCLCLFSCPPQFPPPSCPMDALQMGARRPLSLSPSPCPVSCSLGYVEPLTEQLPPSLVFFPLASSQLALWLRG